MTDVEELLRSDAERWRARQEPVSDLDAQVAAALARPARRYLRPVLAAAVVLAVALALTVATLARSPGPGTPAGGALAPISGVTWRDPDSTGTVVYTTGAMRVYDGCTDELAQLRVVGPALKEGPPIGVIGTCTGPAPTGAGQRAALRRLEHFHAVVSGPATWARVGNVLTLTAPGKGTLRLTTDGAPAPQIVGSTWHLAGYAGTDDDEHQYAGSLTFHVVADGSFEADVSCGRLTGTAEVAPDTIEFTPAGGGGCSSGDHADAVIEAIMSGQATYAIRGVRLILNGSRRMLVYEVGTR